MTKRTILTNRLTWEAQSIPQALTNYMTTRTRKRYSVPGRQTRISSRETPPPAEASTECS